MDSTFLGYMQEQEEREEIIRKIMRAYRANEECKFSTNNYFSPADLEEMKQEAVRRVDGERY